MFVTVCVGLWGGLLIGLQTEYFTSNRCATLAAQISDPDPYKRLSPWPFKMNHDLSDLLTCLPPCCSAQVHTREGVR